MENEDAAIITEWRRSPRIVKLLSYLVAVLMFAMMGVTFADVIGRYLIGQPIPGGFEIIEFIMGPMIFAAIPIVSYNNSHITVSLFDHMFRGRVRRVQQTLVLVFTTVMVGFIAERMFDSAEYLRGKAQVGLQLDIQVAPVVYTMSLLAFIACLLLALLTVRYLRTGIEPVSSGSLD
ncbi:MAG: TRAP transporter small permease [Rhodospirillales bacterium]|jgi:TRAP-type C4-dicarboxylate transport system permease small subunit|nr:TRAP transporter small permease [Rhodospirillales bacterium]MDP6642776.1 TRAP transporter small permease [Rhodospirillales bacterium]|tara:strand:+ start:463 stop:993 length:531 start_codon:yes stop_codon:yes gene_type:complete